MNTFVRSFVSSIIMVAFLIALDLFGVINLSFTALLTFFMMLAGFMLFAYSFGTHHINVTSGSAMLFLLGLVLFLEKTFMFSLGGRRYFQVILIVTGISLLLARVSNPERKALLFAALVLIIAGAVSFVWNGNFYTSDYFYWMWEIVKKAWTVFLLLFIYLIILIKR